jgi:hypothetical protein
LPAPEGPTIDNISPFATVNDTSFTTVKAAYFLDIWLTDSIIKNGSVVWENDTA